MAYLFTVVTAIDLKKKSQPLKDVLCSSFNGHVSTVS